MAGVGVGNGTTATFGTSSFAPQILSLAWEGRERAIVETSHMGTTTNKTFTCDDLTDQGEVTIEFFWSGARIAPFTNTGETLTVNYAGDGAGYQHAATVMLKSFGATSPMGDMMKATGVWKVSGGITIS